MQEKTSGSKGSWPKGLLLGGRDCDGGEERCQHIEAFMEEVPSDFCGPLNVLGGRELAATKLGVPFSGGELERRLRAVEEALVTLHGTLHTYMVNVAPSSCAGRWQ